jgi:two-component system response regulator AtoC
MLKYASISSALPSSAVRYRMDAADTAHAASSHVGSVPEFIAIGSTLRRLLQQMQAAGPSAPLASFEGEPGTGKHLLACTMHQRSSVAALPFRRADAAQWLASEPEPTTLRGTLYLERVDQLSPSGQSLLLQFLKSLEDAPLPDFQLRVASHSSLRQLASQSLYLADLAFRLSAVRFLLPPLRDHREDIAALAQSLIGRISLRYRRPPATLVPGVLPRLLHHPWPGTVRVLASQLEAAILASSDGVLVSDCFDLPARAPAPTLITTNTGLAVDDYSTDLSLDAVILRHLQRGLEINRGNKLRAARQLGISRSTLYRLLAGQSALQD